MNLLLATALGSLALLGLINASAANKRARRAERQLGWALDRSNHYFNEAAAARRLACEAHADLDRHDREAAHFDTVPLEQPVVDPAALAAELDQFINKLLHRDH